MIYSFYHKITGQLHPVRHAISSTLAPKALALNTPPDHVALEGEYDHLSQRVDLSGSEPRVVDYQPPQPSADHEWNPDAKRWMLSASAAAKVAAADAAKSRIAALERQQPAAVRDAVLRGDHSRLAAIDAEISSLNAAHGE